jgi:uncharacterized membrane protein
MFESVAANFYRAVMWAGHVVCQQNPARSPHLFGAQFPLCWRCTGIALGSVAFLVWLFAKRRLPALWLSLALALLMPLDVLQAVLTHGDGDNARRLVTGTLWGFFAASLALHCFILARSRWLVAREKRRGNGAAHDALGEIA